MRTHPGHSKKPHRTTTILSRHLNAKNEKHIKNNEKIWFGYDQEELRAVAMSKREKNP
jgi:hypothetical protein